MEHPKAQPYEISQLYQMQQDIAETQRLIDRNNKVLHAQGIVFLVGAFVALILWAYNISEIF